MMARISAGWPVREVVRELLDAEVAAPARVVDDLLGGAD